MGLFMTNKDEIYGFVREEFGETDSYIVGIKHNSLSKSIIKTLLSTTYRNIDSNREYILFFDLKGIYEKEFGFSDRSKFLLIPWNEIESLIEEDKGDKVILSIDHLGKKYSYEIPFDGRIMKENRERFEKLRKNNFYRPAQC